MAVQEEEAGFVLRLCHKGDLRLPVRVGAEASCNCLV